MKNLFTIMLAVLSATVLGQSSRSIGPASANPGADKNVYESNETLNQGFESYLAFTTDFSPWTTVDVDGLETYGFTDVNFPNSGNPMAFIVFNPDSTNPSLSDDPQLQPYMGNQFAACFSSVPSGNTGNNDWLISPQVTIDSNNLLKFYAKSYTDEFGLEKMNVAVSTLGNNPEDFSIISGANPVEVPASWTEYTYNLSEYQGQEIYIGIQCVSVDNFIFMVDEISLTDTTGGEQQDVVILDFEDVQDFATSFPNWQNLDVDEGITYLIENHSFPGESTPMAFIAFNPDETDPPMVEDPTIQAHSGERFGACFSSQPPETNNDWLISPAVTPLGNSVFSLWAKSYTDQYGSEKFNVLVSTEGNNPEDFVSISGSEAVEAPTNWTKYSYELAEYEGTEIYLAIQCVSEDAFIFMVDDILIDIEASIENELAQSDHFRIYPNPAQDEFILLNNKNNKKDGIIHVYDVTGNLIHKSKLPASDKKSLIQTQSWTSGLYLIKLSYNDGSTAKSKVLIR